MSPVFFLSIIIHNNLKYFRVTIGIGDPIDTEELLSECRRFNFSEPATRKYITDVIEFKLDKLCRQINDCHYGNS